MPVIQKPPVEKRLNMRTVSWGDFTWVDIVDPAEDIKKYLSENYKFHPLDIEDCFERRMMPKADEYQDYLFVVFQVPVYDKSTRISTPRQWEAFIGDKYLITLHPGAVLAHDELRRECEANEDVRKDYLDNGAGYLLYRILDRTLDAYFPVLDKIITLLDGLEDNVFDEEVEAAKEIGTLRRDIVTQRRVMVPGRAQLVELESKLKRFSKVDLSVYWGDLMDHMNKITETLDEYKEIIEVYKDADFVLSSYRANRSIRMLTVMMAVAIPFLFAAGVYWLSRTIPGGVSWVELAVLVLALLLVAGGIFIFLKRRRFI
jgi:magnesium transporter